VTGISSEPNSHIEGAYMAEDSVQLQGLAYSHHSHLLSFAFSKHDYPNDEGDLTKDKFVEFDDDDDEGPAPLTLIASIISKEEEEKTTVP
jgi:hypothetical protein